MSIHLYGIRQSIKPLCVIVHHSGLSTHWLGAWSAFYQLNVIMLICYKLELLKFFIKLDMVSFIFVLINM